MVRDKHKDREHFLLVLKTKTESHENRLKKIEQGQLKPERMIPVKQSMVANLIQKAVSKYSLGLSVVELTEDFNTIVDLIEESWRDGARRLVGANNEVLNQYSIDPYTQLLNILSIGVLCDLPVSFFQRLAKVIQNDNVVDILFEYILASQLSSWEIRKEPEDYDFGLYLNLKKALTEADKCEAEKLVKTFLDTDWLREQKKAQMFTEPGKSWYTGMWSFESAVVVAIKGLDDTNFRDSEYYPKELVDYYRSIRKS